MTLQEFEKAAEQLKDSVIGKHAMFAELTNGKEQCLLQAEHLGFSCSWDEHSVYVENFGCQCAAVPFTSIVRLVIH